MSNFSLPDYTPIHPATKTVRPRQRTASLPSWGIRQSGIQGQNQTSPEWSLKWILRPAEANALDSFLSAQAKTGAWFLWTPPGAVQARFRCADWVKQLSTPAVWEVQATFRQVFSFALPQISVSTNNFVLTGNGIGVYKGYGSQQTTGSFLLTGNPVLFVKTRPVYVDLAVFTLAAGSPSVTKGSMLPGETGNFAYTGNNILFTYFKLPGTYFEDIAVQIWGWERDFQVDWWGD